MSRVLDGDTITVATTQGTMTVRLHGIDCPEAGQPFSRNAKELAAELTLGKPVTLLIIDTDRYGRTVADVQLPDGRSVNRELVKAGLAWWFRKYAPSDWLLEKLEMTARESNAAYGQTRNRYRLGNGDNARVAQREVQIDRSTALYVCDWFADVCCR